VVASVFGDQPFWGWRVQEEGAGVTMPFKKLSRKRLDQALRVVLDPQRRARAQDLGARLRAEDGTRRAADQVERWATLAPVPRLT
jgi:UDP:flavonoid glycosyltransferase YjiC (YdhE family)